MKKMSNNDRAEFIGQLIDIVEDYIEEREGTNKHCILDTDYDKLSEKFEGTLVNWKFLEERKKAVPSDIRLC